MTCCQTLSGECAGSDRCAHSITPPWALSAAAPPSSASSPSPSSPPPQPCPADAFADADDVDDLPEAASLRLTASCSLSFVHNPHVWPCFALGMLHSVHHADTTGALSSIYIRTWISKQTRAPPHLHGRLGSIALAADGSVSLAVDKHVHLRDTIMTECGHTQSCIIHRHRHRLDEGCFHT